MTVEPVQLGQYLTKIGNLPLLPTQVGIASDTLFIDDKEGRALAQGEGPAPDAIEPVDLSLLVGQAGEGDLVPAKVVCSLGFCMWGYGKDLSASFLELSILITQLREVPAAEGSVKAP